MRQGVIHYEASASPRAWRIAGGEPSYFSFLIIESLHGRFAPGSYGTHLRSDEGEVYVRKGGVDF